MSRSRRSEAISEKAQERVRALKDQLLEERGKSPATPRDGAAAAKRSGTPLARLQAARSLQAARKMEEPDVESHDGESQSIPPRLRSSSPPASAAGCPKLASGAPAAEVIADLERRLRECEMCGHITLRLEGELAKKAAVQEKADAEMQHLRKALDENSEEMQSMTALVELEANRADIEANTCQDLERLVEATCNSQNSREVAELRMEVDNLKDSLDTSGAEINATRSLLVQEADAAAAEGSACRRLTHLLQQMECHATKESEAHAQTLQHQAMLLDEVSTSRAEGSSAASSLASWNEEREELLALAHQHQAECEDMRSSHALLRQEVDAASGEVDACRHSLQQGRLELLDAKEREATLATERAELAADTSSKEDEVRVQKIAFLRCQGELQTLQACMEGDAENGDMHMRALESSLDEVQAHLVKTMARVETLEASMPAHDFVHASEVAAAESHIRNLEASILQHVDVAEKRELQATQFQKLESLAVESAIQSAQSAADSHARFVRIEHQAATQEVDLEAAKIEALTTAAGHDLKETQIQQLQKSVCLLESSEAILDERVASILLERSALFGELREANSTSNLSQLVHASDEVLVSQDWLAEAGEALIHVAGLRSQLTTSLSRCEDCEASAELESSKALLARKILEDCREGSRLQAEAWASEMLELTKALETSEDASRLMADELLATGAELAELRARAEARASRHGSDASRRGEAVSLDDTRELSDRRDPSRGPGGLSPVDWGSARESDAVPGSGPLLPGSRPWLPGSGPLPDTRAHVFQG